MDLKDINEKLKKEIYNIKLEKYIKASEFSQKIKNDEIKYLILMNKFNEISNQKKLIEEKLLETQENEKLNSLKINNLNTEISNFIKEKKKFEDHKINYENKITDLDEEIKSIKDKNNSSIKKITNEIDKEKE